MQLFSESEEEESKGDVYTFMPTHFELGSCPTFAVLKKNKNKHQAQVLPETNLLTNRT